MAEFFDGPSDWGEAQAFDPTYGAPSSGGPSGQSLGKEWERKQRNREYRIASRREKRNRKADEKKQRKLNATILRRMTRNPEKYNKNADRNRLRSIEMERRTIYREAIKQFQNLAAEHDPSGVSFNVSAVVRLEDGTIISTEALKRREERKAQKEAKAEGRVDDSVTQPQNQPVQNQGVGAGANGRPQFHTSKRQLKKQALYAPREVPPKPILPEGILIPEGEQNWLELWDLPDDEVERRVKRAKKHKQNERKALRLKQKSGKIERRAARDEKRRVYRDIKLEWKAIKAEQTTHKKRLAGLESEEAKKIAVWVNETERQLALDICASLGFTIENTPGVEDCQPKLQGMKGAYVDFEKIEKSDKPGDIRIKRDIKPNRVDLGAAAPDSHTKFIGPGGNAEDQEGDEFIKFEDGEENEAQTLNYNHKVRRKIRRAMDTADLAKEILVRERAIKHFEDQGQPVPDVLRTAPKPNKEKGHRILESGKLETDKQERVRARVELTEFNNFMKILRRQAKEAATLAGLKLHAELTGRLPRAEASAEGPMATEQQKVVVSTDAEKPNSPDLVGGSSTDKEETTKDAADGQSDDDSEDLDSDVSMGIE